MILQNVINDYDLLDGLGMQLATQTLVDDRSPKMRELISTTPIHHLVVNSLPFCGEVFVDAYDMRDGRTARAKFTEAEATDFLGEWYPDVLSRLGKYEDYFLDLLQEAQDGDSEATVKMSDDYETGQYADFVVGLNTDIPGHITIIGRQGCETIEATYPAKDVLVLFA